LCKVKPSHAENKQRQTFYADDFFEINIANFKRLAEKIILPTRHPSTTKIKIP
jgi:hypothetical protein